MAMLATASATDRAMALPRMWPLRIQAGPKADPAAMASTSTVARGPSSASVIR